jgi:hypothetical protein
MFFVQLHLLTPLPFLCFVLPFLLSVLASSCAHLLLPWLPPFPAGTPLAFFASPWLRPLHFHSVRFGYLTLGYRIPLRIGCHRFIHAFLLLAAASILFLCSVRTGFRL